MPELPRVHMIMGLLIGALVVTVVAAFAVGGVLWRRATARRLELLAEAVRHRDPETVEPVRRRDIATLPPPVARYLAFALPDGQVRIRTARIRWDGDMRLRPDASWRAFHAEQRFTVGPPGFVWDASVRMLPLLPARVRDIYIAGHGEMLGRLGGVLVVVKAGGTPEMAQSALARWLGEAVWLPTALIPGAGVEWEAVDDSTARATVSDGDVRVSGEFRFASTGEVIGMTSVRYRDADGSSVLTPFEGRYARFARFGGVMVPTEAEAAWLLPEGRFAYWRASPVEVSYDSVPTW